MEFKKIQFFILFISLSISYGFLLCSYTNDDCKNGKCGHIRLGLCYETVDLGFSGFNVSFVAIPDIHLNTYQIITWTVSNCNTAHQSYFNKGIQEFICYPSFNQTSFYFIPNNSTNQNIKQN
eukprot:TRINITY_DN6944_c0_g1_i1.p1 TRINITY_DN6944_c0_g1~~TRINITY_DN6944_c0_g1_i1.p1  ORF type:complete len:122 (-),score=9.48 TRINITY_DN6944_c0_g1_i1:110-475(-)